MTWKDWEPWEDLYKKWTERISETKINLTWPSLKGLWQWFVREIESRGIDVETIDVEALLDPTLTASENKQILLEEMKAPLTEKEYDAMYQEQKGLLEKEAEEKYPEIITPLKERMLELEREADKKKRYQKLVKTLRWELAETVKRLEQERAKPIDVKPVKLWVLRDFREGIIAYKSGQMVETRDLEWALQKIEQGFAERLKPELAMPPAVPPERHPPQPPKFNVGDIIQISPLTKPEDLKYEVLKVYPHHTTPEKEWLYTLKDQKTGKVSQNMSEYYLVGVEPKVTLPPAKPRELTVEEKRRLEDEFQVTLIRELGRVPKNSMAEFRLELDAVKTQPFEKAREIIMELTKEIIGREHAKVVVERLPLEAPPRERIRIGIPEEMPPTALPPEFVVYPVELPRRPLNPAPFPRAPTSEERAVIWDWFQYEMSRLGVDPYRFRKVLEDRLNIPYRTWEGFLKTLQEMVKDIEGGKPLALIPLIRIPMPWEEKKGTEKWRRDAIIHFVATKLYKTMEELIDALATWGVYSSGVVEELKEGIMSERVKDALAEVKEAVKEAWKTKDVWFTSVNREELESLIGESVD